MDVYVDDGVYTADNEAEEGASLHAGFTTLHVSQVLRGVMCNDYLF